jgi:hypothetical protein
MRARGHAPSGVLNSFTASFNGGADTFTGTDAVVFGPTTFTNNLTILGGTGIFNGATGFATGIGMMIESSGNPAPNFNATVATSGSGAKAVSPESPRHSPPAPP